jgi:hypothetical protein
VLFENGVSISRADFETIRGTPGAVQGRIDKCLASEPQSCEWDWKYACTTGHLRPRKGNGNLVENIRTKKRREKQAAEATKLLAEEQKKDEKRQWVSSSAFLVTVVMTVVGIGSAIMSAYHTSVFLFTGGKPLWVSVLTGVMLILFSGTAFTAARYFFQEKGVLWIFGGLFVAAGLAVIVYSMFSTLTVNFNQFKWQDDEQAITVKAGNEALAAHGYIIEETRQFLSETNAEIAGLEVEMEYWRTQSWRRYDEFSAQLTASRERRDTLRDSLTRLEAATPDVSAQAAASEDTIYTFLARLLGIPEDTARFFVYAVPACLYDILAPFALSVVLLLADRRKKDENTAIS